MSPPFAKSLPVLMYHYVNDHKNTIAVSCSQFEEHCRALAENDWRGVGMAEAEAFLAHGEPLPAKSVLITFDDGYLDNYMHAMPILHKYGHKGVMFSVTARIEAGETPRATVESVLRGTAAPMPALHTPIQRDALGYEKRQDVFCNYGEIRAMDAAGILTVGSHSRGHLGVFLGPEHTNFTAPGDQCRTFYPTVLPWMWGLPAFKIKPGLANRAFLPSPELIKAILDLVPQDEAEAKAFFAETDAVARLTETVGRFAEKLGRFETDAERLARMRDEIIGGKTDLEAVLGHTVHTLCWPWGKYCAESLAIGREAGFSVFLTTREGANPPGKPLAVHRFKGKARDGDWLLSRVGLYSRPWLGALYARLRM